MNRLLFLALFALAVVSPLLAQQHAKPVLHLSCTADKVNVTSDDSVSLTISLENRGSADVYVYRILEWGWAGIGFTLTNSKGDMLRHDSNVPFTPK